MKQLAMLISNAGTGSNLQAIIDAIEKRKIHAVIAIVISDTNDAYGLKRAIKHHISTHILKPDESLKKLLKKYEIDYICLGGWKKIIPNSLIHTYHDRILNIHPGLIPDTMDGKVNNPDGTSAIWNKGKFTNAAIRNFLVHKATYAGSSIHFLTGEFDFGPVLDRCFERIQQNDSVESLYERLKKKEHKIYVHALQKLCQ